MWWKGTDTRGQQPLALALIFLSIIINPLRIMILDNNNIFMIGKWVNKNIIIKQKLPQCECLQPLNKLLISLGLFLFWEELILDIEKQDIQKYYWEISYFTFPPSSFEFNQLFGIPLGTRLTKTRLTSIMSKPYVF